MLADEAKHERELIALIDEERLKYVGSVVLGLNDALVEFTGTLAGLTFAIQDSRIIAVAGLITVLPHRCPWLPPNISRSGLMRRPGQTRRRLHSIPG